MAVVKVASEGALLAVQKVASEGALTGASEEAPRAALRAAPKVAPTAVLMADAKVAARKAPRKAVGRKEAMVVEEAAMVDDSGGSMAVMVNMPDQADRIRTNP